jgi:putative ABC transport system substrate-binding protein
MRLGVLSVIVTLFLSLAAPHGAHAQAPGKVWRIGYLSLLSEDLAQHRAWSEAFREGLRELGYVPGVNAVLEERYASGRVQRLPALVAELLAANVDVIVAAPSGAALTAMQTTSTVPIVFMGEPDPVGTKLVASLARPGGNVTGLADAHSDLVPKRLELLKQILPSATRVGFMWNGANRSTAPQLKSVQDAGAALGLTVVPIEVADRGTIERAFAAIGGQRLGSLVLAGDPTLGIHRNRIAELALTHKIPTSGTHRGWTDAGMLMSYGTDFMDLFRRGAGVVDRILKGAKPETLPVEQPTKFELILNLRTAKALGVTVPPAVLGRADRIIE